ncbi:unnamed protein product [Pedinophyceae sp. YPF-701]|nr:unnamed protein product [Pedinophyceae sp. YPF-701]
MGDYGWNDMGMETVAEDEPSGAEAESSSSEVLGTSPGTEPTRSGHGPQVFHQVFSDDLRRSLSSLRMMARHQAEDYHRRKEEIQLAADQGDLQKLRECLRTAYQAMSGGQFSEDDCSILMEAYMSVGLHCSISRGHREIATYLLSTVGLDPEIPSVTGLRKLPVHVAAEVGAVETLTELCEEYGAAPDALDALERTPLHYAALCGKHDTAQSLITAFKAPIDARSASGESPLHEAAGAAQADVVALLLEHGADVMARDVKGRTALHTALATRLEMEAARDGKPWNARGADDRWSQTSLSRQASLDYPMSPPTSSRRSQPSDGALTLVVTRLIEACPKLVLMTDNEGLSPVDYAKANPGAFPDEAVRRIEEVGRTSTVDEGSQEGELGRNSPAEAAEFVFGHGPGLTAATPPGGGLGRFETPSLTVPDATEGPSSPNSLAATPSNAAERASPEDTGPAEMQVDAPQVTAPPKPPPSPPPSASAGRTTVPRTAFLVRAEPESSSEAESEEASPPSAPPAEAKPSPGRQRSIGSMGGPAWLASGERAVQSDAAVVYGGSQEPGSADAAQSASPQAAEPENGGAAPPKTTKVQRRPTGVVTDLDYEEVQAQRKAKAKRFGKSEPAMVSDVSPKRRAVARKLHNAFGSDDGAPVRGSSASSPPKSTERDSSMQPPPRASPEGTPEASRGEMEVDAVPERPVVTAMDSIKRASEGGGKDDDHDDDDVSRSEEGGSRAQLGRASKSANLQPVAPGSDSEPKLVRSHTSNGPDSRQEGSGSSPKATPRRQNRSRKQARSRAAMRVSQVLAKRGVVQQPAEGGDRSSGEAAERVKAEAQPASRAASGADKGDGNAPEPPLGTAASIDARGIQPVSGGAPGGGARPTRAMFSKATPMAKDMHATALKAARLMSQQRARKMSEGSIAESEAEEEEEGGSHHGDDAASRGSSAEADGGPPKPDSGGSAAGSIDEKLGGSRKWRIEDDALAHAVAAAPEVAPAQQGAAESERAASKLKQQQAARALQRGRMHHATPTPQAMAQHVAESNRALREKIAKSASNASIAEDSEDEADEENDAASRGSSANPHMGPPEQPEGNALASLAASESSHDSEDSSSYSTSDSSRARLRQGPPRSDLAVEGSDARADSYAEASSSDSSAPKQAPMASGSYRSHPMVMPRRVEQARRDSVQSQGGGAIWGRGREDSVSALALERSFGSVSGALARPRFENSSSHSAVERSGGSVRSGRSPNVPPLRLSSASGARGAASLTGETKQDGAGVERLPAQTPGHLGRDGFLGGLEDPEGRGQLVEHTPVAAEVQRRAAQGALRGGLFGKPGGESPGTADDDAATPTAAPGEDNAVTPPAQTAPAAAGEDAATPAPPVDAPDTEDARRGSQASHADSDADALRSPELVSRSAPSYHSRRSKDADSSRGEDDGPRGRLRPASGSRSASPLLRRDSSSMRLASRRAVSFKLRPQTPDEPMPCMAPWDSPDMAPQSPAAQLRGAPKFKTLPRHNQLVGSHSFKASSLSRHMLAAPSRDGKGARMLSRHASLGGGQFISKGAERFWAELGGRLNVKKQAQSESERGKLPARGASGPLRVMSTPPERTLRPRKASSFIPPASIEVDDNVIAGALFQAGETPATVDEGFEEASSSSHSRPGNAPGAAEAAADTSVSARALQREPTLRDSIAAERGEPGSAGAVAPESTPRGVTPVSPEVLQMLQERDRVIAGMRDELASTQQQVTTLTRRLSELETSVSRSASVSFSITPRPYAHSLGAGDTGGVPPPPDSVQSTAAVPAQDGRSPGHLAALPHRPPNRVAGADVAPPRDLDAADPAEAQVRMNQAAHMQDLLAQLQSIQEFNKRLASALEAEDLDQLASVAAGGAQVASAPSAAELDDEPLVSARQMAHEWVWEEPDPEEDFDDYEYEEEEWRPGEMFGGAVSSLAGRMAQLASPAAPKARAVAEVQSHRLSTSLSDMSDLSAASP